MQPTISAGEKSHDNSDEMRNGGMQSSAFLGPCGESRSRSRCRATGWVCSPDPQPDSSMNAIMPCATNTCNTSVWPTESVEIRDDAHVRKIPAHTRTQHTRMHRTAREELERGFSGGRGGESRLPHLAPWALCALAGPLHQDEPYKNVPSQRLLARLIKLHKDGRCAWTWENLTDEKYIYIWKIYISEERNF